MNFKDFNKSDKIKIKIIKILSDYNDHTPSEIASIINSNNNTILNNCLFLEFLDILNIEEKETLRTVYYIKLNENPMTKEIIRRIREMDDIKM